MGRKIHLERHQYDTNMKRLGSTLLLVTEYLAAATLYNVYYCKTSGRKRMDDAKHLNPLSASWSASGVDIVEVT